MGSTDTLVPGSAKFVVGFVPAAFVAATSAAEVAVEPPAEAEPEPLAVSLAAAESLMTDPEAKPDGLMVRGACENAEEAAEPVADEVTLEAATEPEEATPEADDAPVEAAPDAVLEAEPEAADEDDEATEVAEAPEAVLEAAAPDDEDDEEVAADEAEEVELLASPPPLFPLFPPWLPPFAPSIWRVHVFSTRTASLPASSLIGVSLTTQDSVTGPIIVSAVFEVCTVVGSVKAAAS